LKISTLSNARRGAPGYSEGLTQVELDAFIATFDTLHVAEIERLRAIMNYAETGQCRMQFLREYFGEASGSACKHCDNCNQRAIDATAEKADSAQRRITAPITAEDQVAFRIGAMVRHKSFGMGEVLQVENDQAIVSFNKHGERRILASKLKLASRRAYQEIEPVPRYPARDDPRSPHESCSTPIALRLRRDSLMAARRTWPR
jgi:hypothetical protein